MLVLSYDGIIAYPHYKLNDAADYFLNKHNPNHDYAGYELHNVKVSQKTKQNVLINNIPSLEADLLVGCFKLCELMEKNGVFGNKQADLFKGFIELRNEYQSKNKYTSQTLSMDDENGESKAFTANSTTTLGQ